MNVSPVFLAFLLTILAGLATGFGSMIALVSKRTSPRFLSLVEPFGEARHEAVDSHSCDDTIISCRRAKLLRTGALIALGFILAGVAGIMIYISLDELLPSAHEYG